MEEIIESTVNAVPVENVVDSQTDNTPVEQVETTTNVSEEVVVPQVEEKPVQSAEENAKFAAVRREAEQKAYAKAQDELIASMYGESHGIYTKADYDKAVKEAQEQSEIQSNIDKGIDPEIAKELAEAKKFREQFESEKQERAKQEYNNKQFMEFSEAYPGVTGEEISQDVWQQFNSGVPLKIAYAAQQENASLKAKLAEYEKGTKTQEVNNKNALASTGSTVGNGSSPTDFIAKEVFEANKKDSNWLDKNYDLLRNSMNKW